MKRTFAYAVRGMDCAEEVAALRRSVGGLPGVSRLDFDILRGRMAVTLEPGSAGEEEILSAVRKAGLDAVPWQGEREGSGRPGGGFRAGRGRLLMACLSGVFLLSGFLTHSLLHGSLFDALVGGGDAEGHVFPLASVLLYLGAIAAGAWYVAPKALLALRRLLPDMNLLMAVAVCGAAAIGEWFEAATVSFLFSVALLLESWSVGRARRAVADLMDLSPVTARFVSPRDGSVVEKPVEEVPVGVTVFVRPGEKVPLDGVVLKGSSLLDQAPITGESVPVRKGPGDEVYAGTLNDEGAFSFRVTRPAGDTTLARIIHLVEEARARRAPSERWVESFARVYTPAMMALALALALLPPLALGGAWGEWIYRGLVLLVIACPCALVISTPVSVVSALASAARSGVLIKGGAFLEAAARLQAVALDKTGTLTRGRPEVREVLPLDRHTPSDLLSRAAALEIQSEHPLARAVLRKAAAEGVSVRPADGFRAIKGKGAEGRIGGRLFWIGSHRLMHERGQETEAVCRRAEALEDAGHSVLAVGTEDHVCGLIAVADGLRPEASEAVRALRASGVRRVVMLTGDNEGTARAIAEATGVDEAHWELLPEDKIRSVESLVRAHRRVAMVGDGVNDAPAMAAATLGIAMGSGGTDAAIETADVVLMADDLSRLPWLVRHARRTLCVIRQNVFFALGLKVVFIGLSLVGMVTLWMAVVVDMGASLLVIFNGLRLLKTK